MGMANLIGHFGLSFLLSWDNQPEIDCNVCYMNKYSLNFDSIWQEEVIAFSAVTQFNIMSITTK